ncbi:MAG TPA: CxxxxCH/CxxCH domain-containing protein [Geothrix sp.]|nr:CxxxxCH/CxxCH domain-containing protein [Geothrix sp.]
MNTLSKPVRRFMIQTVPVVLAALVLLGCGSGKSSVGVAQYYGNYHVPGWLQIHGGDAVKGVDACTKCHEISVIKVGSGIPTCLTSGCHHQSTPGWANADIHGLAAKAAAGPRGGSLVSCQMCHAKDFSGGASASACASCHGVKAPHPAKPWRISAGSAHTHTTTDPSNAAVCAQCHFAGSPNNPAHHPATPAPAGTQPGCYNATLCHGATNAAPHPVPFLTGQSDSQGNGHLTVTASAFAADCASCHAVSGTSPIAAAPLCNVCHQLANPTAAGTGSGTCLSCHSGTSGLPKGPGGSSFPSQAGAHAKHMGLATALTCDSCHAGSGSGSTTHYTLANGRLGVPTGPAPVSIDPIFAAKTGGAPTFNPTALTCSAASCHGGQTTPSWQNGTITSSTQCLVCHGVAASAGTLAQFNDAFGRHSKGSHDATNPANGIACTTCHDMANGSPGALAHFKYLNTQAVDGVSSGTPADQMPSGTIVFDTAIVLAPGTYTVASATQGNGGCALTCHTHVHVASFNTWTASGAPHPIPFLAADKDTLNNGHMTANSAIFTADCGTCHAVSGPSPNAEAPLCSVCHTAGDPTAAATGTGTCLSCHVGTTGLPTGPEGSAFPSIAGAHAKHMALPTALSCATCHGGSGTGTRTHYDNANARVTTPTGPAPVAIAATFNAQSGTASFNPTALTCAAASCHGGQVTPNWRTGTIVSATQCSFCHATNGGTTTSQFNDAVGRHAWGTHASAATLDCTLCHDMAPGTSPGGANHFAELDTTAVSSTNKLPSGTIKFKLTNATFPITGAATYTISAATPEGDGGCALTCHSQVHNAVDNHWKAPQGSGIAHPKPFLSTDVSTAGYHHQTVTLTQFNLECINCHDQSGTTTKSAPVCTACHTLGSPVATGMTAGTCLSCHVGAAFATQGPTGAAWPSLQGAHPKHLALATFTRTSPALPATLTASAFPECEACHVGSAPGDPAQTHYSNANKRVATPITSGPASVTIAGTFNAKSGTAGTTASASAFTCSNVSCHGGQTTPGWQTGSLTKNATTYCIACHVVTSAGTQYNDATGRHVNPSQHNVVCSYCHDMTQATSGAQNHFKYLDTSVVSGVSGSPSDQFPSTTIKFDPANVFPNGTGPSYTASPAQGQGYCTLTCHSGGEQHDSGRHWY